MQTQKKKKKPSVEVVHKPILTGSWHGKDAWKLAGKRVLSMLAITFLYLVSGLLLSFNNLWVRVGICACVVFLAAYYQYYQGMVQGQGDVAFGEIMYARQSDGRGVTESDRDRCFHPMKGMFAALVGSVPYVIFTAVFACLAKPTTYTLGALPSWTQELLLQTEFSDAMCYYGANLGIGAMDVMRIIDRAMVMPFINVATALGSSATLLVERLSPVLILIPPVAYGIGYTQGQRLRNKINTGIKMGDDKKRKRERKARKQRQRSSTPERLI